MVLSIKKLAAVGIITALTTAQGISAFAADGFYVSQPACNSGFATGSCAYQNSSASISYDMKDTVSITSNVGSYNKTYSAGLYIEWHPLSVYHFRSVRMRTTVIRGRNRLSSRILHINDVCPFVRQ